MKKTLSLTLAVMMLLGCMSLSAFAADNTRTLTITAEVPSQKLSYDMVIPERVEPVTATGVHKIGAPSVANVKNGNMATVISYKASGTAFKSEGKADMPATYCTDSAGKNALDSQTPIKVYECNAPRRFADHPLCQYRRS